MRRPTTYHHGDLRRVIIEATLKLVEKDGVDRLSLREIARRAGVSHAAPYHHFGDKAGVLAAIAAEGFRELEQALRAAVTAARTPRNQFEACGRAYVLFAVAHPAHFRVMFRPEIAAPAEHALVDPAAGAAFRVLVEVIAVCRRAGLGRGVPAPALALTGWSTMHGLAALLVDGPSALGAQMTGDPAGVTRRVARTLGTLLEGH